MARQKKLDKALQEKIYKLSSTEEKIYFDLQDLTSEKIKSDFSTEVVGIMTSMLQDITENGIEELQLKLIRVKSLKEYIKNSSVGKKEKDTLLNWAEQISSAIKKDLSHKKNLFSSASSLIENLIGRAENTAAMMFADDPLIKLIVKGAATSTSFVTKKVQGIIQNRNKRNAALKQDASSLLNKNAKVIKAPKPTPTNSENNSEPGLNDESTESFEKSTKTIDILETISIDVKTILNLMKKNQDAVEDASFDEIERLREQNRESMKAMFGTQNQSDIYSKFKNQSTQDDDPFIEDTLEIATGGIVAEIIKKAATLAPRVALAVLARVGPYALGAGALTAFAASVYSAYKYAQDRNENNILSSDPLEEFFKESKATEEEKNAFLKTGALPAGATDEIIQKLSTRLEEIDRSYNSQLEKSRKNAEQREAINKDLEERGMIVPSKVGVTEDGSKALSGLEDSATLEKWNKTLDAFISANPETSKSYLMARKTLVNPDTGEEVKNPFYEKEYQAPTPTLAPTPTEIIPPYVAATPTEAPAVAPMETPIATPAAMVPPAEVPVANVNLEGALPKTKKQLQLLPSLQKALAQRNGISYSDAADISVSEFDSIVKEASKKYNVPASLINAVIMQESNFNPYATSRVGAQGLMQLMPATAKDLGVTNAYDPYQNIMGGTKYLAQILNKFNGNVDLALAGYNAGPNRKSLAEGRIPDFDETKKYVVRVKNFEEKFRNVPNEKLKTFNEKIQEQQQMALNQNVIINNNNVSSTPQASAPPEKSGGGCSPPDARGTSVMASCS